MPNAIIVPRTSLYLTHPLQPQIHVRPPPIQALHADPAAKVLCVRPAQRQPVPQPGDGAAPAARRRDDAQAVVAAAAADSRRHGVLFVAVDKCGERIPPYVREDIRADAAAAVADADRHAGGVVIQRGHGVAVAWVLWEELAVRRGHVTRLRGDRDHHRLMVHGILDRGAEGVLEQLRDDVLEVHGDKGERRVGLAVNDPARAHAVVELAYVGHEAAAAVEGGRGPERRVDDADVARVRRAEGRARGWVEVRGAAEVQGNVLLGDEARANTRAQVLVEEAGYLRGGDVFAALEEAAREDGDRVGVGLDELGEDFGEADLVVEAADGAALPGKEGGQGVLVVVVDVPDVGVGDDDVGKVAEGLDAVRQADWEEGEGEARRGEEGVGREGRAAMSGTRSSATGSQWEGRGGNGAYFTRSARLRGCKGCLANHGT